MEVPHQLLLLVGIRNREFRLSITDVHPGTGSDAYPGICVVLLP
jgi:hypothetical protein